MRDHSEDRARRGGWQRFGSGIETDQRAPEITISASGADGERLARLARTIEGEIVPRLVLARRVPGTPGAPVETKINAPDVADVSELVRLLLAHEVAIASGFVQAIRRRCVSLEVIFLDLLAPAARELGLLWENDECDFMQVTVGLCRLHHLLREISAEFRSEEDEITSSRTVLLAPVPGEQHTFGVMLVAQFLRRAGWDVWNEFPSTQADIVELVRQNWFAVVGLSVGCDSRLDDVAEAIAAIRAASRNRSLGILVGGPVLSSNPQVATLVGADATATDARQAVEKADYIRRILGAVH